MITKEIFGTLPCGTQAELYTITNENGMAVKVTTYGGILVSVLVPDKNGVIRDVVLGYDTLQEYVDNDGYLSATVGRFANRIVNACFTLNGKTYHLPKNDGSHSLHGGGGFSSKVFTARAVGEKLELSYLSPDGEDGYPGNLTMTVTFWLDSENALHLDYTAKSDADTICNLTNHAYFNLFGGEKPMLSHKLWLNADKYTATDAELIPVGDVTVEGTEYDFRTPKTVGSTIYDNNFVLGGGDGVQATVYEEETGILLEMFTDRPDVQVYASAMLTDRKGKNGCHYSYGHGLCLETQVPPNAPNRPECTGYVLPAGEVLKTSTVYRFSVK